MRRRLLPILLGLMIAVAVVASGVQPALAQEEGDMKALMKEIQEIKKGQEEIKKDIDELKGLMKRTARAAAAPPPPTEAVVSIDDDPFKGEETAKLTMVEFSDYQ
jgi:protein-disulfide isomerase